MEDKLRLPVTVDILNLKRTALFTKHTHYFSIDEGSDTSGTEDDTQTSPPSNPRKPKPQRSKDSLGKLLAGTGFDAILSTSVAPLVRVKLLLQTQNEQIRSGRLSYPYGGIKDCLFRTIKREGFLSLWRGNLTNIALRFETRAVGMGILSCFPSNASPKRDERHGPRNYSAKAIALACFITTIPRLLTYPLEFGITRLACDVKQPYCSWQFTSLIDTYKKMLISNGIAGLYRGYSMALCGDLVAFSIVISRWKTEFPKQDDRQIAVYVTAPIFMISSTHLVLYPLDTMCRRMMMTTGEEARYSGAVDAFRKITKREGLLSLYKGMGASLLRGAAAFFLGGSIIKLMGSFASRRD